MTVLLIGRLNTPLDNTLSEITLIGDGTGIYPHVFQFDYILQLSDITAEKYDAGMRNGTNRVMKFIGRSDQFAFQYGAVQSRPMIVIGHQLEQPAGFTAATWTRNAGTATA